MARTRVVSKFVDLRVDIGVTKLPERKAKEPRSFKTLANGRARQASRTASGVSTAQVAAFLQKRYRLFSDPFNKNNENIQKAVDTLALAAIDRSLNIPNNVIENSFIAAIKNPILEKKYGSNKSSTIRVKGFDRVAIDTGIFFNSITAKLVGNR